MRGQWKGGERAVEEGVSGQWKGGEGAVEKAGQGKGAGSIFCVLECLV